MAKKWIEPFVFTCHSTFALQCLNLLNWRMCWVSKSKGSSKKWDAPLAIGIQISFIQFQWSVCTLLIVPSGNVVCLLFLNQIGLQIPLQSEAFSEKSLSICSSSSVPLVVSFVMFEPIQGIHDFDLNGSLKHFHLFSCHVWQWETATQICLRCQWWHMDVDKHNCANCIGDWHFVLSEVHEFCLFDLFDAELILLSPFIKVFDWKGVFKVWILSAIWDETTHLVEPVWFSCASDFQLENQLWFGH